MQRFLLSCPYSSHQVTRFQCRIAAITTNDLLSAGEISHVMISIKLFYCLIICFLHFICFDVVLVVRVLGMNVQRFERCRAQLSAIRLCTVEDM